MSSSDLMHFRRFAVRLALVGVVLGGGLASPALAETSEPSASEVSKDGVVNINTASVEQLRLLPRIGEEKAKRIIAHREKTPFRTVHELARVRGIGLRSLRALKPWLAVSGPTTLTRKATLPRASKEADAEPSPRARPGLVPARRDRG